MELSFSTLVFTFPLSLLLQLRLHLRCIISYFLQYNNLQYTFCNSWQYIYIFSSISSTRTCLSLRHENYPLPSSPPSSPLQPSTSTFFSPSPLHLNPLLPFSPPPPPSSPLLPSYSSYLTFINKLPLNTILLVQFIDPDSPRWADDDMWMLLRVIWLSRKYMLVMICWREDVDDNDATHS